MKNQPGRPPKVPRPEKIRNARIFVATQIIETGAPPSVRKLALALGYTDGSSARTYHTVRQLSDNPGVMYVETDWQNFFFPTEVYEAMVNAAKEVLEKEGVKIE